MVKYLHKIGKYLLLDQNIVNNLILLVSLSFFLPKLIFTPIIIGVVLIILINRNKLRKPILKKNDTPIFLFFLYFILLLTSLLYSRDYKNGVEELFNYLSFIIVPIIILYIRIESIDFNYIAKNYVTFLLYIFLFLFLSAIYRNFLEGYNLEYIIKRLLGMEIPSNRYAYFNYWHFVYDKFCEPLKLQPIYLGLFTNIGLAFLFLDQKTAKTIFFYFKIITLFILLTLIGSRWQLGIGIINFILFLFLGLKEINIKIKFFSGILVITSVIFITFLNPITRTRIVEALTYKETFYEDTFGGTSIRIRKWKNAINIINKNPFLGYGIGDYKEALLNQYKKDKFYLGYYEKFNAHNQYLDTNLAIGFFGLIVLLSIFYTGYKYSRNNIFLFFISNIYFLSFFTESMFSRQWGIISFPFFFLLAFIYNYSSSTLNSKKYLNEDCNFRN